MKESKERATGYRFILCQEPYLKIHSEDSQPNRSCLSLGKTCVNCFAREKLQMYYVKIIRNNVKRGLLSSEKRESCYSHGYLSKSCRENFRIGAYLFMYAMSLIIHVNFIYSTY